MGGTVRDHRVANAVQLDDFLYPFWKKGDEGVSGPTLFQRAVDPTLF